MRDEEPGFASRSGAEEGTPVGSVDEEAARAAACAAAACCCCSCCCAAFFAEEEEEPEDQFHREELILEILPTGLSAGLMSAQPCCCVLREEGHEIGGWRCLRLIARCRCCANAS